MDNGFWERIRSAVSILEDTGVKRLVTEDGVVIYRVPDKGPTRLIRIDIRQEEETK